LSGYQKMPWNKKLKIFYKINFVIKSIAFILKSHNWLPKKVPIQKNWIHQLIFKHHNMYEKKQFLCHQNRKQKTNEEKLIEKR